MRCCCLADTLFLLLADRQVREFLDRLFDDLQRVLQLLFGDDQGRRDAHDSCPAGLELDECLSGM